MSLRSSGPRECRKGEKTPMKNAPFDLTGQVAVITGSSRGIGRASAELLASLGAKVVISSRKAEACHEGADGISKAADFALCRSLAGEWGPQGVRVNCVAPGLVKTDFARALWEDEERLKGRCATTPLRRIGQPDEIAGAVAYLASDASTFMTGQTIVIDGGVTTAAA